MSVKQKYLKDEDSNIVSPITSISSIYDSNGISLLELLSGTILYQSSSGTNDNITLSEDVSNFKYIVIIPDTGCSIRIDSNKFNGLNIAIEFFQMPVINDKPFRHFCKTIQISGKTIVQNDSFWYDQDGYTSTYARTEVFSRIVKVIGYKL